MEFEKVCEKGIVHAITLGKKFGLGAWHTPLDLWFGWNLEDYIEFGAVSFFLFTEEFFLVSNSIKFVRGFVELT